MSVRAKKHLGQHFLNDDNICRKIADAIQPKGRYQTIVEIGPGMGALTKHLFNKEDTNVEVMEVDTESIAYLEQHYPDLTIHDQDFLKADLRANYNHQIAVVGNFPYNISSQILFHVLGNHDLVPEVVGMFQKEVAQRVKEPPGSKTYGILSVLVQAYYEVEYLFTVSENVFIPPPKVKSGVIRLTRLETPRVTCDPHLFKQVVKQAFNQRRKTLRNSLKSLTDNLTDQYAGQRPEQLSVEDFVALTEQIQA